MRIQPGRLQVHLWLLIAFLLLGSLFFSVPAEAQPDTSPFVTLVQYVVHNGLRHQDSQRLRVDPRIAKISHDSYTLRESDLIDIHSDKLRLRVETLNQESVPQTDIVEDYKCFDSGGLRLPGEIITKLDSTADLPRESNNLQRCKEKGAFTSVIFGQPRSADRQDYPLPDSTQRQKQNKESTYYAVRAIEITSYSFSEYDIFLRYTSNKSWTVVGKKLVDDIAS